MSELQDFLIKHGGSEDLVGVVLTVADGVIKIAGALENADSGKAGSKNVYGEEQMALDVLSNKIFLNTFASNKSIGLVASEELSGEENLGEGEFAVCMDPLDGSSLIDVNLTIGSILGIYKTRTFMGTCGRDQVAAVMAVYGPKTTMILSIGDGVHEFSLRDGVFVLTKEFLRVGEGKMFAPGNLRICAEKPAYLELVNYWCKEGYTLRYSGGMVPDINQILLKGYGIFTYPGSISEPDGKLRLLFECAPIAYLVEQAGGAASDGYIGILDKKLHNLEQRSQIFVGSSAEVERSTGYMK